MKIASLTSSLFKLRFQCGNLSVYMYLLWLCLIVLLQYMCVCLSVCLLGKKQYFHYTVSATYYINKYKFFLVFCFWPSTHLGVSASADVCKMSCGMNIIIPMLMFSRKVCVLTNCCAVFSHSWLYHSDHRPVSLRRKGSQTNVSSALSVFAPQFILFINTHVHKMILVFLGHIGSIA